MPKQRKNKNKQNRRRGRPKKKDFARRELMAVYYLLPPKPHPRPLGPHSKANFSSRALIETFTDSSGLTNGHQIMATSSATYGSIAVEIADLDGFSGLSATFDQYRIDMLEFFVNTESPAVNATISASPNLAVPNLWMVIDRDDATVLSSISAARQYDNVIVIPGWASGHLRFTPSVTPAYYASSAFAGYGTEEMKWLDVASNNVPHYGIKWACQALQSTSTQNFVWNVECYVHFSFRNTR